MMNFYIQHSAFRIHHSQSMTTGEFEKTNWGWQLSQLQQQVGEWIELQLSRFDSNLHLPEWYLPRRTEELIKAIAWLLLGLLLIWLGWQLWRLLEPYLYSFVSQARNPASITTNQTSELAVEEWLKRSQAYFNQGNYREACRCLYMAVLQRLHERAIAPHQPSRTDREYLQLVQQLPQSQSYQTLIATHEQLCFGNAEIALETFAQCQQAYQKISREE